MALKPAGGLLPVLSLLLSATMWGLVWYPLRLLEQAGLHGLWNTFVAYLSAFAVGAPLLLRRHRELARDPSGLLIIALAAGWTNVAFILAVLDGTVVRVLLLFYLSPLWAVLMGWLLLGERLDGRALLVFAMAVSGALVMLWDPTLGVPWPRDRADWLAVSSGFAFALTNVVVRKLQDVSVGVKTVVSWAGDVLVALGWIAVLSPPQAPANSPVWLGAVALGLGGYVLMTVSVQYGVTRMPVHRSAVILLFELVVGAVSSLLLTNETVSGRDWGGGALILLAACLTAYREGESA